MNEKKPARVRFAPSPTGRVHLGSARTALYNYLLAHQTGGKFILRLEDTDRRRYVPGAEDELMRTLRWLGLQWDEGIDVGGPDEPYRQSERKEIYLEYAHKLIDMGHAYFCFCTPAELEKTRQEQMKNKLPVRYPGTCRRLDLAEARRRVEAGEDYVIRFKMPEEGTTTVHDHIRGDIIYDNKNLDDYIIVRSDGLALYHLAAMVDDYLMKITHVIRGSEWLPSFPLHINIINAFGWEAPDFMHLSVFLKPSGKGKMSKRESADLSAEGHSTYIGDLEQLGYLPEAVVNWIALMGWSYDDRTEFFPMDDLIEKFSIDRLNPSPAAINFSKLDHFNGVYIRSLPVSELARRLRPFFESAGYFPDEEILLKITPIIQERMVTLDEGPEMAGFFFEESIHPNLEDLVGKKMTVEESVNAARRAYQLLQNLPQIGPETTEEPLRALSEELGLKLGQFLGILRVAVTGRTVSPPLLESMEIIGKEKVLERIQNAIQRLEARVA